MSLYLLQGAVEEGLIYALVSLGLLISYGILNIADMTTDGSFVLGAAVSSVLTISGHPILGLIVAVVAGMGAGFVTALMQTRFRIPSILAGIITMTGLYTVNLIVQNGTPNLFFPEEKTLFSLLDTTPLKAYAVIIILGIVVFCVALLMIWFFTTQIGLSIRATGDNIEMVQASSINPRATTTLGLCLSNSLVALAGALLAQKNTQGDINIGTGVVVIGLAGLVLGEAIFRSEKIGFRVVGAIIGAVLYRMIFTIALRYTPDSGYLKIVSAAIVAVVIGLTNSKKQLGGRA